MPTSTPQIITSLIQLGESANPANNLFFRAEGDGTVSIARCSDGRVAALIGADNKVTFPGAVAAGGDVTVAGKINSESLPTFVCRGWAKATSTGTGNYTIVGQGNIASIVRTATGYYSVTFTTKLPDGNYAVSVIPGQGGVTANVGGQSDTGFNFMLVNGGSGAPSDQNSGMPLNITVVR